MEVLSKFIIQFFHVGYITEYRILSAWDEESLFGKKLEGKLLLQYVPQDSHSATINACSAGLVAPNGSHITPLVFWEPTERRIIEAECAMVSDASDPSVLFIGAAVTAKKEGETSLPTTQLVNRMLSKETSGVPPLPPNMRTGIGGTKSADASGMRLTAASLILASGSVGNQAPPGLWRKGETPCGSLNSERVGDDSRLRSSSLGDRVPRIGRAMPKPIRRNQPSESSNRSMSSACETRTLPTELRCRKMLGMIIGFRRCTSYAKQLVLCRFSILQSTIISTSQKT